METPTSDPVLRAALPSDARAIAQCHIECWHEAFTGLVPAHILAAFSVLSWTPKWNRTLRSGLDRTVVAEVDAQIIGFGNSGRDSQTRQLTLFSLYVRQQYHGTGVAQALMTSVIGDEPCLLWVIDENPRARAFYSKYRFRPTGRRRLDLMTSVYEIEMARSGPKFPLVRAAVGLAGGLAQRPVDWFVSEVQQKLIGSRKRP